MKNWQRGIEIETLKEVADFFKKSDGEYLLSPFTEFNKMKVAKEMSENNLIKGVGCYIVAKDVKTRVAVKDFSGNIIATRQKGDLYISRFAYSNNSIFKQIEDLSKDRNTWIAVWQENKREVAKIKKMGFKRVCSKVSSHSEIIGVYYKGKGNYNIVKTSQLGCLERICDSSIKEVTEEFNILKLEFTNHFSNYNPTDSWGALSLRGYSSDYKFISKPGVMGKKWKDDGIDYKLQYTELWEKMPSVKILLEKHFPKDIQYDRIRLMRLGKNVGVLERHSDKTEKDAGVDDGMIARFHFPLQTNEGVCFEMWGCEGEHIKEHLQVGDMWYLDMRKPHRASNTGTTDRIHLVVDVISNPEIRVMLGDKKEENLDDIFE